MCREIGKKLIMY